MKSILAFLLILMIPSLVCASGASADEPPALRYDPFRDLEHQETAKSHRGDEDEFQPVLRSTIVRGKRSLVNLGGEILAVGENTHGYKLLSVRPFDATFLKDGERVKLEVVRDEESRR